MGRSLQVGAMLPDILLPSATAGAPVPLRPAMPQTTVLVTMHSVSCLACVDYIRSLGGSASDFEVWDARLLVVAHDADAVDGSVPPLGVFLADPLRRISGPDEARVVVADRYGQVFDAHSVGAGHGFPAPRQLEEWLKFLGTLCPE